MKLRLGVVISHPIQHYSPLFRYLAQSGVVDVRVFYCCDWGVQPYHDRGFGRTFAWDVDLLSGYDSEFLEIAKRPEAMGFWDLDNPGIGRRLDAYEPHALWLHGYSHATIWRAASWAKGRAALLHFGDSELLHARPLVHRLVKEAILRWHFNRCDAFITIGDNNEAHYRHYGVPEEKLFRGACPVDVGRFRLAASDAAENRTTLRDRFGLRADDVVALQVGKLEPRKRPLDLVDSIASAQGRGVRVAGLLVGDGPLRTEVEDRIREKGLEEQVKVTGFVNQSEMPRLLSGGDILVVASDFDPHPLVVTEAMALGLPIVASSKVGCVGPTDAAREGVNAMVYACGDVGRLSEALTSLVTNPGDRRRLGEQSAILAGGQDLPVAAAAVARALGALGRRRPPFWSTEVQEAAGSLGAGYGAPTAAT